MALDRTFWESRYTEKNTGWDIGGASPPLKAYFDGLTDRGQRILIPGGGRAYEAEYLHRRGFTEVFVIDLTDAPMQDLLARCPVFPADRFIVGDFFAHHGTYDLIIEQTFFCALDPELRDAYVDHMHHLLRPGGKLRGLLFDVPLNADRPPFGGTREEYLQRFGRVFDQLSLEPCHNSLPPRQGTELWLRATRT